VLLERADALSLVMSATGLSIGVAGGAAALFAYTVSKGAAQYEAFQKSIVSTNGALGLSAEQMINVSNTLADAKTSLSSARETLAALAETGRFAGDDLALAGRAAVAMSEDTGESADKAVDSLVKLHGNIIDWLTAYQEQHHTFTAAQVDEIEGFVRAGDAASAQKAIMLDLIAAHDKVQASVDKAKQNGGFLADLKQGWLDIVDVVSMYKNMIVNIGVPDGITKQVGDQLAKVEAAQRNLAQQQSMGALGNLTLAQEQLAVEQKKLATLRDQQSVTFKQQRKAESDAKGGDAAVAVNAYLNSTQYATPLQQRNLAIQKENADYAKATQDVDKTSTKFVEAEKRHADNLAEIDKQYANRNGSKAAASAAAAAAQNAINAQLTALDAQQKAIETGLKTSLDHIKSLQDQGLITQEAALTQAHDARAKALADQLAIEQQEVQIATGKKQKSAMEKYAAEVKATQDKISANDAQYTDDSAKLAAKRVADLKVYTSALQQQLATQQSAADAQLAGLSLGGNDRADFDRQIAIRQDYDRKVADLAKQRTENKIGPDQYASELAATQDYYNQSVAIAQKSSADIRAANADWTTGAKRAIADYSDQAANVAASTASAFSDAFRGMEDAFASFVTTGKLNFSSLATSVITDIARMQARSAISGLFNYAASAVSSYFSPSAGAATGTTTGLNTFGFHLATGGAVSGPGTSTSDSIPAMLSNGEGVLNARAMQKLGVPALNALNQGNVHGMLRFATGGYVGSAAASTSSAGGLTIAPQITVEGGSNAPANQSNGDDLNKKITAAVRAVVVNERKQGGALWKMKNGIA